MSTEGYLVQREITFRKNEEKCVILKFTFYVSIDVINVFKSNQLTLAEHVTYMGVRRGVYQVSVSS